MKRKQSDGAKSVDHMMTKLASYLVRDFQANFDDPLMFQHYYDSLNRDSICEVRHHSSAPIAEDEPSKFKAAYQMQSLFKRYRYQTDTFTDDELTEKAISSFLETQSRISAIDLTAVDDFTSRVLEYARMYIAQTLGVYDDVEHRNLCRFGKKAAVGIPARLACEAERWELPLTGSEQQIAWFDSEMSQIDCVQDYWNSQRACDPNKAATYQTTSCLTLTLVPKTFKSLRSIMPNTNIGSYMSYGLGEMLRIRLRRKGYNIRSLQMQHRVMARSASLHKHCTTADLSSASDSISIALVEALFPHDWLEILNQSRIGDVLLPNGSIVTSKTYCTMGIGYTFPLQTLVFLSLLKAIEATLYNRWNRRTISVYGDDLIYSSELHPHVVSVFEQIGFVINLDKTFHEGDFRESCGGDYYRGVDVRPFQPRNGAAIVSPKTYEAILYKYINGLLMRWSEYEIERTLSYLMSEVESVAGKCKLVPHDFPDDSGVKCPTLKYWSFIQYANVASPKKLDNGLYRFSYLRLVPAEREEVRHEPYYWARLRDDRNGSDHSDLYEHRGAVFPDQSALVDYATQIRENVSPLSIREVKPIKTVRSQLTGRRLRRTMTCVVIPHTGRYMRRSGISCFETRR